jgi:hypothetical protein
MEDNYMTIELILALWGAVISTILAIIKIISFVNDRPRIKVSVDFSFSTYKEGNEIRGTLMEDEKRGTLEILLNFTVINSGKKPIQITGIIIKYNNSKYCQVIPRNFPVVLDPLSSIEAEIQKEWIDKEDVVFIGVVDALGRKYPIKKDNLNNILVQSASLPSNKKMYRNKKSGEIVYAFKINDNGKLINTK